MPEWHQLDSSSTMSKQQESAKKKTLKSSSRSFWFSTGLVSYLVKNIVLVKLGDNHIKNFHLWKYVVEYMVRNLSFMATCDFRSDYISNDIPPQMNFFNMVPLFLCTSLFVYSNKNLCFASYWSVAHYWKWACLVFISNKRENIKV